MVEWHGPGTAFTVLCDEDDHTGPSLPTGAQAIYGDWRAPAATERPYVYSNFVMSHDGRVSFSIPGAIGGGAVSGGSAHDRWLMGLLRARADAVLVGDNTLRLEPEHIWTPEGIFPAEAGAYAAWRAAEGRSAQPLHVFASHDGAIPAEAAVFARAELRCLIVSTQAGVEQARARLRPYPTVGYLPLGHESVDLNRLMRVLRADYGVCMLLCEGGPTLFGSLVKAGEIDDLFLTLSPLFIGNPRGGPTRPGLVEGVGFDPATAPAGRLIGLRRAGSYLFLRTRLR